MSALNLSQRFFQSILSTILFGCALGVQAQTPTLEQALDTTALVWTTGGDAAWFGETTNSYDGNSAACSVLNGPTQTSWLQTTVVGPATLSFWIEMNGGTIFPLPPSSVRLPPSSDLSFVITPPSGSGSLVLGWGTWNNSIYDLPEGTCTLRWTFYTTAFASNTVASAFLDQVVIGPPRPLQLTYQPLDQTVYSRAAADFFVSAIGTPPISYQWRKDGTNLLNATNSWLHLDPVSTNDSGLYSVLVSNSQGFQPSTNALLTVLPPSPPSISWQPSDATLYVGQSAWWLVSSDGSPPFAYQWRKDGTNLPGATSASLLLPNVQLSDAGTYSVQVTNTEGGTVSSNAVLTVLPTAAPVLTVQPCSLNVAAGSSPTLSVQASGTPDPQYQWLKNGANVPGTYSSTHSSTLTFNNVTVADSGIYSVRVSNLAGTVMSSYAILNVLPAPVPRGLWGKTANSVFVTNHLAYVAQGANGISILDVTNPDHPSPVGACATPSQANAARVVGGLAYVADGFAGLQILAITNPASPLQLGACALPGMAQDVCVAGNRAYVADWDGGLQILDISNPAHPLRLGAFVTNMCAASVRVVGGLAFVGCPAAIVFPGTQTAKGLQILDISNPAQPVLLAVTSRDANAVDVLGNTVATGGLNSGLCLFDFSNPSAPVQTGTLSFFGLRRHLSVWDLRVVGNLAYVAAGSDGLWVIDVSAPSTPTTVAQYATAGFAEKVAVAGSRTYVALGDGGLQIIDIPANLGIQPAPAWVTFTATPISGSVPLTVHFTSAGTDSAGNTITNWHWDFGDGSTSTLQNPPHTYTNVGTFFPTLVATNSLGETVIGSGPEDFSVNALPSSAIEVTLSPSVAVAAGARWQVDGGPWQQSGAIVTNVPAGNHTISFNVLDGWLSPASQSVTLAPGQITLLTAAYTPQAPVFLARSYNGLFFIPGNITHTNSGFLTLKTTTRRSFSGKVFINGGAYPFSGQMRPDGTASVPVKRGRLSPLTLGLELLGAEVVAGWVTNAQAGAAWTAPLLADRAGYATNQGRYTMLMLGTNGVSTVPAGCGYATVTVDKNGKINMAACLADGTKASQSVPESKHGQWPLYVSLYGGKGSILSWIAFTNAAGELGGDLSWCKPATRTAYSPEGLCWLTEALGTRYHPPGKGTNVFGATNSLVSVVLSGGNLSANLSNDFVVNAQNRAKPVDTTGQPSLTITPSTGVFSGSRSLPGTRKMIPFHGILLQNQTNGYGYFLGTNQSGQVELEVPATSAD